MVSDKNVRFSQTFPLSAVKSVLTNKDISFATKKKELWSAILNSF